MFSWLLSVSKFFLFSSVVAFVLACKSLLASLTPFIAFLILSKFAINSPTNTTKAPIPVAIIAPLKNLNDLDVVSTDLVNKPITVEATIVVALFNF